MSMDIGPSDRYDLSSWLATSRDTRPTMALVFGTASWISGIVAAHSIASRALALLCSLFVAFAFALIGAKKVSARWVAGMVACAVLGGGRLWLAEPKADFSSLRTYNDLGWAVVEGYVSAEPSIRDTYTQLQVSASSVEHEGQRIAVRGRLVLNTGHYPAYRYGDRISVSGLLETPPARDEFDYRQYLATRGIHTLVERPSIQRVGGKAGSAFLRRTYATKEYLRGLIDNILPSPESGLLSGILLGLAHTLPDDVAEAFRRTGLTHIIVISGFNISLLLQALVLCTRPVLHRWATLTIAVLSICAYACFVGPSSPVVRAAIIGALFACGQLVGRKTHAVTSLALASLLMTVFSPLLLWEVSFQLSFVATLALIVIDPWLGKRIREGWRRLVDQDPSTTAVRNGFSLITSTVAAQIATLPLLWYHFGQVSPIALLANLLVLPVQPATMIAGAAATAIGSVSLGLGQAAAWLAWPLLRYAVFTVQTLGSVPWAAITVPSIPPLAVWSAYAALAAIGLYPRLRRQLARHRPTQRSRLPAIALAALLVLGSVIWANVPRLPDGKLHVYVLDVGQGDAILIRSPGGRYLLVDGGPDPLLLASRVGQILPFWHRRIDVVVATHEDQDHLAGLIPIIRRYTVDHVLQPDGMGCASALGEEWASCLQEAHIEPVSARRGLEIAVGSDMVLTVLNPVGEAANGKDDNAQSIALALSMGRCSILLTGDINQDVERGLVRDRLIQPATLLKVAHHGSAESTCRQFLQAAKPRVAVISVGKDNRFGHPTDETVERLVETGCAIYRTDQDGTVEFITDGELYWVQSNSETRGTSNE